MTEHLIIRDGHVWSPEERDERYDTSPRFPRDRNHFVVQGNRVPWDDLANLVDQLAAAAGPTAVVCYYPWAPGAEQRRSGFGAAFGVSGGNKEECLAQGPTPDLLPSQVLRCRAQLGGESSGTWFFGTGEYAAASLVKGMLGEDVWTMGLQMYEQLQFGVVLDEGAESALFVCLQDRTAGLADLLRGAILQMIRP